MLANSGRKWQGNGDAPLRKLGRFLPGLRHRGADLLRFIRCGVTTLLLSASVSAAQDFEVGLSAAKAGDFATAKQEWFPLAESGHIAAQFNLGLMYSRGDGVAQDDVEAMRFFRMAAEQGEARAQYNVGAMYRLGEGVPLDYVEAVRWYRLAAEQGNGRAQSELAFMYGQGLGVPQNYVEAAHWYRLAAVQGVALAQYNIGVLYRLGEGVPQDYVASYMWLNISAASGLEIAADNREITAQLMTAADISEAQRRARICMDSGYQECD